MVLNFMPMFSVSWKWNDYITTTEEWVKAYFTTMADKLRETSPLLNSANSQLFVARYVDVVNKLLKVERRELSTPFFPSITMESEGVKKMGKLFFSYSIIMLERWKRD